MRTMEEYTAELDRRIDEKTELLKTRRRRVTAVCAALAVCLCALGAWQVIKNVRNGGPRPVPGIDVELPLDGRDRFVMGNDDYSLGERTDKDETRLPYSGLIAFEREGEIAFTFIENGPIYTLNDGEIGYVTGALPVGAWYGAAYYKGGVYMPATDEVVCGLERSHGLCRYDLETKKTDIVIASEDEVSSPFIMGDKLVYASNGKKSAVIKLCDLSDGKIYKIAELERGVMDEGWLSYFYNDAAVVPWGDGLAVAYGGKAYSVSFGGEVKQIAGLAWDINAEGDRLYVFREVHNDWGASDIYGVEDIFRRQAEKVEVFSAASGGSLGEFDLDGYALCCCDKGRFTLYRGGLAAVKDGELLILDPVGGGEQKLMSGMPERVAASVVGDSLLTLSDTGRDELDYTGEVHLIEKDGAVFGSKLPAGLNTRSEVKLSFGSVGEAQELLYEPVDIPVKTEKLEAPDIYGYGVVFQSTVYGERRESTQGRFETDAKYLGKKLKITVDQEQRDYQTDFANKLGLSADLGQSLLAADALPLAQTTAEGTLYADLVYENGTPIGIMTWFDDAGGRTVDIEVRLLRETREFRTVITLLSDELTADEIRALLPE